ncbi:DUF4062 domain-containing protein [Yersinia enterocolitica]
MEKKLQVFVSSTFTDLKEERQAAVSAILRSGHIPAGMELFTAGDQSQLDIIKNWIDESDVYMLILGGRYGSIEANSGFSYTELEYNYALEKAKPLFSVVINESTLKEKVKLFGPDIIERENPKELRVFREKVLSYMSSFYDDVKDIKLCVLESLPEIARSRELSGWVSGADIPDTKELFDEISRLLKFNEQLKNECEELKLKSKKINENNSEGSFDELLDVLQNIKFTIPEGLFDFDTETETNLYELFYSLKERLITGVTNKSAGMTLERRFMYFTLCPKLLIHDLVMNEQVVSAQYRRFCITKRGQLFLSYVERLKLEKM